MGTNPIMILSVVLIFIVPYLSVTVDCNDLATRNQEGQNQNLHTVHGTFQRTLLWLWSWSTVNCWFDVLNFMLCNPLVPMSIDNVLLLIRIRDGVASKIEQMLS